MMRMGHLMWLYKLKEGIENMKAITVGLGSLILIGALVLGFIGFHFINSSPGSSEDEIVFEVQPGQPFNTIAQSLVEKRVVNNARLFRVYAQFKGALDKIKVGEYGLRSNMRPGEVLEILMSGKSRLRKFVVTEGLNIFEVAEAYEKQGFGSGEQFLKKVMDPVFAQKLTGEKVDSLEGFLFPETYELTKFTTMDEVIGLMVQNFKSNFEKISPDFKKISSEGWTLLKVLTLASIVEKETGAPDERPQISGVFHNRIKKGMMLQTDPTIIYGLAVEKKQTIYNISKSDILRPTPYNTYVIKGLPPGPIANPGLAALRAAVVPSQHNYLYFVSKNDGTHVFSETYEKHEAAVAQFQLNKAAREGKSWRDLNKDK